MTESQSQTDGSFVVMDEIVDINGYTAGIQIYIKTLNHWWWNAVRSHNCLGQCIMRMGSHFVTEKVVGWWKSGGGLIVQQSREWLDICTGYCNIQKPQRAVHKCDLFREKRFSSGWKAPNDWNCFQLAL